jgi:hypothetical protein
MYPSFFLPPCSPFLSLFSFSIKYIYYGLNLLIWINLSLTITKLNSLWNKTRLYICSCLHKRGQFERNCNLLTFAEVCNNQCSKITVFSCKIILARINTKSLIISSTSVFYDFLSHFALQTLYKSKQAVSWPPYESQILMFLGRDVLTKIRHGRMKIAKVREHWAYINLQLPDVSLTP